MNWHDKLKIYETKNNYELIQILKGRSNVFLLSYRNRNILIDTSIRSLWKKLDKQLQRLHIKNIDYLILTHSHFDHAGNARRIKDKYNANVIVHESEVDFLNTGTFYIPKGTFLISQFIITIFAKVFASKIRYEPCKNDFAIVSSFDFNDLGLNLKILHTPGHTSGSLSIIIDDEIAIVGDTLFGIFKWSIMPPYAVNVEQLTESWKLLANTRCELFYPSHGSVIRRTSLIKAIKKHKQRKTF